MRCFYLDVETLNLCISKTSLIIEFILKYKNRYMNKTFYYFSSAIKNKVRTKLNFKISFSFNLCILDLTDVKKLIALKYPFPVGQ